MSQNFTRASGLRRGYDRAEVDEFFGFAREVYQDQTDEPLTHRDIHTSIFSLVRGGYVTTEVDAAMDRLENAFVARDRQNFVTTHGQGAWAGELNERAQTLYPRLKRADGTRFSQPARGQGYDKRQVDAMCADLTNFFDGKARVTAAQIRSITFAPARGRKAYEEGSVDSFVARAVEVLLGVQ